MGCLESEVFSGSVIQSVLDHSQLLFGHGFHATLLGNVLAQQSVEVLVAPTLPAVVRIGKESLNAQRLAEGLVICKFLAIVHAE